MRTELIILDESNLRNPLTRASYTMVNLVPPSAGSKLRYDDGLAWLNILFLLVIALIPFPTAVFSTYGDQLVTIYHNTLCGDDRDHGSALESTLVLRLAQSSPNSNIGRESGHTRDHATVCDLPHPVPHVHRRCLRERSRC